MLDNIGLLNGMTAKMNWLNARQTVVSGNVANADTPGFVPSDLKPIDFGAMMRASKNKPTIGKALTDSAHIAGPSNNGTTPVNREQKTVYEAAPDGQNAVVLEEQLFKAQGIQADYTLMTSLYRKNVGMLKMAIGR